MSASWTIERPFLATFSFIGFASSTISLCCQFRAWNVGSLLYGFWAACMCLIQFVDHMVWWDDAKNRAPLWCDISLRVTFAGQTGIVAAASVIARRVSKITTGSGVYANPQLHDKRKMICTDLVLGLSVPITQIIIYNFIQDHRFDIEEGVGCSSATSNSIPVFFLCYAWSTVLGLISGVYCTIIIRSLRQRRNNLREILGYDYSIPIPQYLRLLAMAITETCCTVPLSVFLLNYNATDVPIEPWGHHSDGNYVVQYPTAVWTRVPGYQNAVELNEWLIIGCALVYSILFGLNKEARKHYVFAFKFIARSLGFSSIMPPSGHAHDPSASVRFARNLSPRWPERRRPNLHKDGLFSEMDISISDNQLGNGCPSFPREPADDAMELDSTAEISQNNPDTLDVEANENALEAGGISVQSMPPAVMHEMKDNHDCVGPVDI